MLTGTEKLMEDFSLEIPATPAAPATSDNAMNLALPAAPSTGESLLPSTSLTGSDAVATALGIFPFSGRGGSDVPSSVIPAQRRVLFETQQKSPEPIVKGKTIICIRNPNVICAGVIGTTGLKFCCNDKSCDIASHKQKAKVNAGMYILDKHHTGGALLEPTIKEDRVNRATLEKLLNTELDLVSARDEIILLLNQDDTTDDTRFKAKKSIQRSMEYKTPSKLRTQPDEFNPSDLTGITNQLYTVKEEAIKSLANTKLEDMSNEEAQARIAFGSLQADMDMCKALVPNMAAVIDALEANMNEKEMLMVGLTQRTNLIEAGIGNRSVKLDDQGYVPTIWGSLAQVVDQVDKMVQNTSTQDKENEMVKAQVNGLIASEAQRSQNTGLDPQLVAILQTWKQSIENLVSRTQAVENFCAGMKKDKTSVPVTPVSLLPSLQVNSTSDSKAVSSGDLHELKTRIHKLERSNERNTQGMSGAVRFSGVTFTGIRDVESWLDSFETAIDEGLPPYGLFADPQLLLHWIWIVISGTTSTSARDMRDRIVIAITQDKLYAVDSFQHFVPLIFAGKKSSSLVNTGGMQKSRLDQIPTFENWDDVVGQYGLKQQIMECLGHVKDSISELIEETFSNCPELRAFTLAMLHTSASFIQSLATYMSETYNNFKDVVGDGKAVWGLVTYVVEQLFKKDFGQVRAKTIGAIDANNKASAVKIIWSSIRSVGVAQELMSYGIKNAPAVSASYVRFVITHSNMGRVSSLLEENKTLKRKHEELTTVVADVKKTAESAKKLADSAISRLGNKRAEDAKKRKKNEEKEEN